VEILESNRAATQRGDWEAIAATLGPNVLIRTDARWPEPFVLGREAVIRFYRGVEEAGGSDIDIERIIDLGDRLVLRERWRIRGQQSGVAGEQRHTVIGTFRAGRIILLEYFLDNSEALKAVGLEE
jgi:SnoaL-like domain